MLLEVVDEIPLLLLKQHYDEVDEVLVYDEAH